MAVRAASATAKNTRKAAKDPKASLVDPSQAAAKPIPNQAPTAPLANRRG